MLYLSLLCQAKSHLVSVLREGAITFMSGLFVRHQISSIKDFLWSCKQKGLTIPGLQCRQQICHSATLCQWVAHLRIQLRLHSGALIVASHKWLSVLPDDVQTHSQLQSKLCQGYLLHWSCPYSSLCQYWRSSDYAKCCWQISSFKGCWSKIWHAALRVALSHMSRADVCLRTIRMVNHQGATLPATAGLKQSMTLLAR